MAVNLTEINDRVQESSTWVKLLQQEISRVIIGQEYLIDRLIISLIANGHVLLEGVRRLFELEVTEIADGTVTIETISREPGYRTKIAVNSNDSKVDPVGACVGARGARVKSIVRELSGEKIDIIRYHSDPIRMLEEAIKPAIPKNIKIDEVTRRIFFEVSEEDLSVAIGRRGQNARLTS